MDNTAQAFGTVLIVLVGIIAFATLFVWGVLTTNIWGIIIGAVGEGGWIWSTKNFL